MEALIVSAGVVALAEIGDKTQLLALLLATRFRKPVPIVLGIFVATLANHAFASAVGNWLVSVIGADAMRWILGVSFIAMAVWSFIPDSPPDESAAAYCRSIRRRHKRRPFRNTRDTKLRAHARAVSEYAKQHSPCRADRAS